VNGFAVVECTCGLARTILPDGFDPASIYTEAYFKGGHKDGYADYQGSGEELRHEFRRILDVLLEHVQGGKLLELGCAFGFFLDEARTAFETTGVEISDHAREECQRRGLDVEREATPEFLAQRGPFDAAVMLDVLEHMPDPGDILERLHHAMRPGAQLVVTTGDYGSLLSRAMGKRWRLMTPPQHLWFFSPQTLTLLLERHGFRVHTVEHPWKLVPIALVAYQATRYLGGQDLVRKLVPGGRVPINLFDAMRVIAERVDRSAIDTSRYELALRHAHGRVLDLACGAGYGTRLLKDRGTNVSEVIGVELTADAVKAAADRYGRPGVRYVVGDPLAFYDDDGFDTTVALDALGRVADPEKLVVRLIAASRREGTIVASGPPETRALFERYGMRAIEETANDGRVTVAWRRA
jgi:2-polyprenyl-3-methyl-5-hydroxy-6-metoxy-1,4-benzoquinol methylase